MEKLRITLELTLEEARLVVSELWQFRTAKEEANKQQPEPNPQPDPKPFKLEYGKRYKRRDGKITGPLVENDGMYNETHPFKDPDFDMSWQPNGQFGTSTNISKLDLIEEA
jgi:hypothetical protein